MCEIFAMSSAGRRCVGEKLKEFYSHSPQHPNGWGLALSSGGATNWEKEPVCADQSEYLKQRLSEPIVCDTALAHIRYATVGNVEWRNCHPFVSQDISGRQWILIHNGTIFDYPACDGYTKVQLGETDSERILLYLMDLVAKETERLGRVLLAEERFSLLEDMVVSMSVGNKLNLIIYDGELLYAHVNLKGSLYRCQEKGVCLLSTRPLSVGYWEEAPFRKLFAYKSGELVFEGNKITGEYIEDKKALNHLYLDYAGL